MNEWKKSQRRTFEEAGVAAGVSVAEETDFLEVSATGELVIPAGPKPMGFNLLVAIPKGSRRIVVQRDLGMVGGEYHANALSDVDFLEGFDTVSMHQPITVIRRDGRVWTDWRTEAPNRLDIWSLAVDGKLDLFQVGVITHDNGKTWKLHGEYRWRGRLYADAADIITPIPAHPKWGSLQGGTANRTQIYARPEFRALLKDAKLMFWDGDEVELNPPLPEVPEGKFAVVDWFVSFAGQTGQGIVKDIDGNSAWVHGVDVEGFDPDSSEPPLQRGDIVSFEEVVQDWGGKKAGGLPKLTGVKLVKRD